MPTYVYRCAKCGEQIEAFQSFSDAPLTKHTDCGGKLTKVLSAAGIVLKGSGFYKTDNRSSSKGATKEKSKESTSSSSDSGSSGSSDSESESTPASTGSSGSGSSSRSGFVGVERAPKPRARSSPRSTHPMQAEIGVFGGSGFYKFGDPTSRRSYLDTPFGAPSAPVTITEIGGRRVAFIPRHGRDHEYTPAHVPARANLWAMRMLGVRQVIGPCAAGSLSPDIHPGDFVVLDQLVDRTWGRADTFYDAGETHHVSYADPYCAVVARHAVEAGERARRADARRRHRRRRSPVRASRRARSRAGTAPRAGTSST